MNIQDAQIYVGTYRKYNEGSLYGKWMLLSDYSDIEEFIEACKVLHEDEEDAEFMFQDYESIPEVLISESWLSENFFDLRDVMYGLDTDQQEAFMVWVEYLSHNLASEDAYNLVGKFREEYQGRYDSQEDFAYEHIESCYELSEFAKTYFDYDKFARDLFVTDYWEDGGFVFRR